MALLSERDQIIDMLERLIDQTLYLVKFGDDNKHFFRLRQFTQALAILSRMDKIPSAHKLMRIKGVGKGIVSRIEEFRDHGSLDELEKELPKSTKKAELSVELQKITGVGVVQADKFINLGVKNIDHFQSMVENDHVKVSHQIKIGLKYFVDFQQRVPRYEIDQLKVMIKAELDKIENKYDDPYTKMDIVGSYRRNLPDSGDIDVMFSHPEISYLYDIVKGLIRAGLLIDHLTSIKWGMTRYMGVVMVDEIARRIDLFWVPEENYYTALVHYTGSKATNIRMALRANEMGYHFGEKGLTNRDGEKFKIGSEQEIFEILGLKYLHPCDR